MTHTHTHTHTNLLYIEVLTAFEDTLSPVTQKIFDHRLFAPRSKQRISIRHSLDTHKLMRVYTHTQTNPVP